MINSAPLGLDLTLALVGKRRIAPNHVSGMKRDLALAFDAIAESLRAAAGGEGARLTLITGLADGADQIASALFVAGLSGSVARALGAVLPCPRDEFALNSPIDDLASFEQAARNCAFITMLPGRLPPPPDGLNTEAAREATCARGDAFAAQADALLQAADMLVAIDDPDDAGEIGGTRHTLRRALNRGMPVILIHLGRPGVSLPRTGLSLGATETLRGAKVRAAIAAIVEGLTATRRLAKKA